MSPFESRNNPQENKNEYSRNFIKKLSTEEQTYVLKTLGAKDLRDPDLSKKVHDFQLLHKKQLNPDGRFGENTWDHMKMHMAEKKDLNKLKQTVENKSQQTFTYDDWTTVSWTGETVGAWKNHEPHGKNIVVTKPSWARFEWEFRDGKQNGQWRLTDRRGNIFEGVWVNGKLPNGTVQIEGGASYTWELGSNLIFEGRGQLFNERKKLVYDGDWANGQKNWQGTFYYPDGRTYVGEFLKNEINGQGTLYNAKGKVINSGNWKKGVITKFI